MVVLADDVSVQRPSNLIDDEAGFTLVEIMVAAIVTVVGLLGAAVMLDQANRTSGETSAREGGNVLTREVLERARQVPYSSLVGADSANTVRATLADQSGATPTGTTGFKIARRHGIEYSVTYKACKVDDPSDGIGVHTADYCDRSDSCTACGAGSSATAPSTSVGLTLAGIPLTVPVGGTLLDTLCSTVIGANPIGSNPTLDALLGRSSGTAGLLALARSGADVQLCTGAGAGQFAYDEDPDDFTRVTSASAWTSEGRSRSVRQVTLIANPT